MGPKPKKRMVVFYCHKLGDKAIKDSVWAGLGLKDEFDTAELDSFFTSDARPAVQSSPKKKAVGVSLLTPKRAQAVGIMLAQFKLPPAEICGSLMELDESVWTVDRIVAGI